MENNTSQIDICRLVEQAQLGCRQSMDILTEQVKTRLSTYIYRLTLDNDTAEDILQETLLEMVKSLPKLRQPGAFWGWIYKTATGKACLERR